MFNNRTHGRRCEHDTVVAFEMQMTKGRAFGAPLKFTHMTKCFAAHPIAIVLVNNMGDCQESLSHSNVEWDDHCHNDHMMGAETSHSPSLERGAGLATMPNEMVVATDRLTCQSAMCITFSIMSRPKTKKCPGVACKVV
eukprot:scaffold475258_cov83-Attheya_sp.AAC.1